jgi:hypothetical protein
MVHGMILIPGDLDLVDQQLEAAEAHQALVAVPRLARLLPLVKLQCQVHAGHPTRWGLMPRLVGAGLWNPT